MNSLLRKIGRCAFLLGTASLGLSLITGCGSGTSSDSSTTPPVTGAVTPTVTVTASPSGSINTAQALSVAVAVTSSTEAPAGSVVLSSGNYASFPFLVSGEQAVVSVPAGLLAVGTDLDGQFHAREYGFVHERGGHHECDGVGFRSGDAGGDGLQRHLFDWRLWQPVSGAASGVGQCAGVGLGFDLRHAGLWAGDRRRIATLVLQLCASAVRAGWGVRLRDEPDSEWAGTGGDARRGWGDLL